MLLAKVIGTVVATRKDPGLVGTTLLVIQPLRTDRTPHGKPLVAVDSVGAGAGEEVFYVRGREASFPFLPAEVPADAAIVGIVDHWNVVTMLIGRVVGNLVATQKNAKLEGSKLLLVQPLDLGGKAAGRHGAGDRLGRRRRRRPRAAGPGRQRRAAGARQGTAAVDAAIVGVVDSVSSWS